MAFPAFPTNPPPDYPVERPVASKILSISFADGYGQDTGQDINSVYENPNLVWNNITKAERDVLDNFLRARKGFERFTYKLPGQNATRTYICKEWRDAMQHYDVYSFSAKFEQRFDVA